MPAICATVNQLVTDVVNMLECHFRVGYYKEVRVSMCTPVFIPGTEGTPLSDITYISYSDAHRVFSLSSGVLGAKSLTSEQIP